MRIKTMLRRGRIRTTAKHLWAQLLKDFSRDPDPRTLFFYPTVLRGDPPRQLDRELTKRRNLAVLRGDEDERGYAPLSFYAELINASAASLIYMLGPQRTRASIHNARASLLAGIAAGLGKPLLIVAEESFAPPIDYQDLLFQFGTARSMVSKVNEWLDELPNHLTSTPARVREALGLPLNLGEYVAEYEADTLGDYFVQTAEFDRVLNNQAGTAVFVGRKGTGKTATMLQAAADLHRDKRNLVTVIKPSGYELESLLDVLERLPDKGVADYFLNGLWEYLLYCEIAAAAVREAEGRPAGIASGSEMDALRAYLETYQIGLDQDLSVRLDAIVSELLEDLASLPKGVSNVRNFLNQKLHASALVELRKLIGSALKDRRRVALLIDNLDKAWERGANYEVLSRVIFGLLSAVGNVARDFAKQDAWREKVNVTLTVFLRADIFSVVLRHAREPDKIETLQIGWPDPDLLLRVIEDRYAALTDKSPSEIWQSMFCATVEGMDTRRYMLWRVLPRPRDLVYLTNAALLTAGNRRHPRVAEEDIRTAEKAYSQFAFEALLVESDPDKGLADLLFEFAGLSATLTPNELDAALGSPSGGRDEMVGTLLRTSFLGLEVGDDTYEFFSDETSERKHRTLARRLSERRGSPARYRIHPAFRPFLEIVDDDLEAFQAEELPFSAVDGADA